VLEPIAQFEAEDTNSLEFHHVSFGFRHLPNTVITQLGVARLGLNNQLRFCVRLRRPSSMSSGATAADLPVQGRSMDSAATAPTTCLQCE